MKRFPFPLVAVLIIAAALLSACGGGGGGGPTPAPVAAPVPTPLAPVDPTVAASWATGVAEYGECRTCVNDPWNPDNRKP